MGGLSPVQAGPRSFRPAFLWCDAGTLTALSRTRPLHGLSVLSWLGSLLDPVRLLPLATTTYGLLLMWRLCGPRGRL